MSHKLAIYKTEVNNGIMCKVSLCVSAQSSHVMMIVYDSRTLSGRTYFLKDLFEANMLQTYINEVGVLPQ